MLKTIILYLSTVIHFAKLPSTVMIVRTIDFDTHVSMRSSAIKLQNVKLLSFTKHLQITPGMKVKTKHLFSMPYKSLSCCNPGTHKQAHNKLP